MKILVYSAKPFEVPLIESMNNGRHIINYTEERLTSATAMKAINYDGVSIFSADDASSLILEKLSDFGVKYITLRSAGYDNINLKTAARRGVRVANSPDYSPYAIAEHALALFLTYNRKINLAQNQTHANNFLLDDLIGFDLNNKTAGVMGTGKIGSIIVKILHGFGCNILANDLHANEQLISDYKVKYLTKELMAKEADIIFICLPLTQHTHHLFDEEYIEQLKKNPILVNVARGAIVKTEAVLNALDSDRIAGYATDVYEHEHGVFFYDRSQNAPEDSILQQLLQHPKVLLTPHQAFATKEALKNIASTTIESFNAWDNGVPSKNELF